MDTQFVKGLVLSTREKLHAYAPSLWAKLVWGRPMTVSLRQVTFEWILFGQVPFATRKVSSCLHFNTQAETAQVQ